MEKTLTDKYFYKKVYFLIIRLNHNQKSDFLIKLAHI
ncbi:hypothetical protein CGSHiR3021_03030 [Haemophilus influenzae 22.4-21]|uniref:Uncharacterized protein n=1 Tax=Haemophilus influenzae 22.4-21 TaxID=375063 RepID=A4P0Z6_HAEIF|nr:hypothetical protein CGSHiR3021_03030 [Haemophilus influenzae 22.4-21]